MLVVVEVVLLVVVIGVEVVATVVGGIEGNIIVVIGCTVEDTLTIEVVDVVLSLCDICVDIDVC